MVSLRMASDSSKVKIFLQRPAVLSHFLPLRPVLIFLLINFNEPMSFTNRGQWWLASVWLPIPPRLRFSYSGQWWLTFIWPRIPSRFNWANDIFLKRSVMVNLNLPLIPPMLRFSYILFSANVSFSWTKLCVCFLGIIKCRRTFSVVCSTARKV